MKIGILGCGNMGQALAKVLSSKNHLFFYDHNYEKGEFLMEEGFGQACKTTGDLLKSAEMIILAIKPQNLREVAAEMRHQLHREQTIVSVLAGTTIDMLKSCFPVGKIVRIMPNLAVAYGEGIVGLSSEEVVDASIFQRLGKVMWLPEEKMDALTALGGSGPAFFFVMIEAMVDAAIEIGFTAGEAQQLVYQMVKGGLTLLEKTGRGPCELKRQIASPGGTTLAGLKKLEEGEVGNAIRGAFLAAIARANEIKKASLPL